MVAKRVLKKMIWFVVLYLTVGLCTHCYGQHDTRRYRFPDFLTSEAGQLKARRSFTSVRQKMDEASRSGSQFTSQEQAELRKVLTEITSKFPGDVVIPYVKRRLIILDWQTGKCEASAASDLLMNLADKQTGPESNLTRAMALTISARDYDLKRVRIVLDSLNPAETPGFGWFVSEWSRYLVKNYVAEGATLEESNRGQPIPEEYRRSVAISDFLESQLFDVVSKYLQHLEVEQKKHGNKSRSHARIEKEELERAQITLAMMQVTGYMRQILGRRLYLDISERTTSILLPQSLDLWQRAVDLLDKGTPRLESPDDHRLKIKVFRESIIPHLEELQESQHLLRDFAQVIASQKESIGKLDRQKLSKLASEQSLQKKVPEGYSMKIIILLNIAVVVIIVGLIFCYSLYKK